jgi:DNA-binding XRE family transcriptional regulator
MLDDFTCIGANRKGGEARAEAALFRQARHALGMTQSDITRDLLVGNWRTIALWEAGDSQQPSPVWLAAIHLLEGSATPERQSAKAAIDREVLTS